MADVVLHYGREALASSAEAGMVATIRDIIETMNCMSMGLKNQKAAIHITMVRDPEGEFRCEITQELWSEVSED